MRKKRRAAAPKPTRPRPRFGQGPAPRPRGAATKRETAMPYADEAPKGARVVDSLGGYAVAMALDGFYLGLFRRR